MTVERLILDGLVLFPKTTLCHTYPVLMTGMRMNKGNPSMRAPSRRWARFKRFHDGTMCPATSTTVNI